VIKWSIRQSDVGQKLFKKRKYCGLYYKTFTIVIYDCNAIGQYYKTMIVDYDHS